MAKIDEDDLDVRPKDFSMNQIDVSISDITDCASLDNRLRELSPVHLLGALPDEDNGDDFTTQDEMRFTLWSTREMTRETDCVDTEDKSTVSDVYPSFDELQKRYTKRDLEQAPIPNEPESRSNRKIDSCNTSSEPWAKRCSISRVGLQRIYTKSLASITNAPKKKLAACVIIF